MSVGTQGKITVIAPELGSTLFAMANESWSSKLSSSRENVGSPGRASKEISRGSPVTAPTGVFKTRACVAESARKRESRTDDVDRMARSTG